MILFFYTNLLNELSLFSFSIIISLEPGKIEMNNLG